jgi:prophage maintenance system killer protein
MKNQVEIYKSPDNRIELKVNLDKDTVWLSQEQLTHLFERDQSVISRHIRNVFREGELEEESNMQKMHIANSDKPVVFYNLDVIISVGYRVNSKRGTQFRQWATQRLKDYLVKGYAINKKRLQESEQRFSELKQAVGLFGKLAKNKDLSGSETGGLLKVLSDFTTALDILDRYDHQQLKIGRSTTKEVFRISYKEARKAIERLKEKFGGSDLFGKEKDDSFKSSLSAIYQTFDGKDVYPSVEEKAAHLLYFVVKNHSFADGNKRIAAFLFIWFLERNNILYYQQQKIIDDNALVALTLMIAESAPDDKSMMVKVIVNLIKNKK